LKVAWVPVSVTSTIGDCAVTVTVSSTVEISSAWLTSTVTPMVTRMFSRMTVLKPANSNWTL
jgi:hypothetical protein